MVSQFFALLLPLLFSAVVAIDQLSLFVNINDGQMGEHRNCSPDEMVLLSKTIEDILSPESGRRLGRCSRCGSYCWAIGCPGQPSRRRRTGELTIKHQGVRKLAQCTSTHVSTMDTALDALKQNVSETCQNFISARTVKCVETTTNCGIGSINLVNAASDKVIQEDITATTAPISFCKSQAVTFEAVTEFYMGAVNFIAVGPNGYAANRTEDKEPYFMHSNVGADVHGTKFPTGDYTVTITSAYEPTGSVSFSFRANNC